MSYSHIFAYIFPQCGQLAGCADLRIFQPSNPQTKKQKNHIQLPTPTIKPSTLFLSALVTVSTIVSVSAIEKCDPGLLEKIYLSNCRIRGFGGDSNPTA